MSEMIERVAKIIDPIAFGTYPDDEIDPRHGSTWASTRFAMRERARAAIAAMREPTEKMLEAADQWQAVPEQYERCSANIAGDWRAMIDEALK